MVLTLCPPHPWPGCGQYVEGEGDLRITVGLGGGAQHWQDTGSAAPTTAHHSCRPEQRRAWVRIHLWCTYETGCPVGSLLVQVTHPEGHLQWGWTGVHEGWVSRAAIRSTSLSYVHVACWPLGQMLQAPSHLALDDLRGFGGP